MKTRLFLAAVLSLAAAACAGAGTTSDTGPSTAAAPASVNPLGRYEFSTAVNGNPVTGGIEIAGAPDAYTGWITTSITSPLAIASVTATGQEMIITGDTPDGRLTIRLTFTDATAFTGGWELAGDSGAITGRRLS